MANGEWNAMPNATIRSFEDLEVWQMAMALAEECYRLTARFPRDEIYTLTAQMRRAAISVPSNVAEGHGREGTASFIQHLRVAQGSLKELQTQVILSKRLAMAPEAELDPLLKKCERIGKMLRSLIRTLQARSDRPEE
jgi:four helix bundle protein